MQSGHCWLQNTVLNKSLLKVYLNSRLKSKHLETKRRTWTHKPNYNIPTERKTIEVTRPSQLSWTPYLQAVWVSAGLRLPFLVQLERCLRSQERNQRKRGNFERLSHCLILKTMLFSLPSLPIALPLPPKENKRNEEGKKKHFRFKGEVRRDNSAPGEIRKENTNGIYGGPWATWQAASHCG